MLAELREIRHLAEEDLPKLYNPSFGWIAGIGNHEAFYGRDSEEFADLSLTYLENLKIPGIIEISEQSLDTLEKLQAKEKNPEWEVDYPGKILHEWRNGFTPRERSEELRDHGWPFFKNTEDQWELRYYGGGDETPRYIMAVATLARAKEVVGGVIARDEYIERKLPSVLAAYSHQIRSADASGVGLIWDSPNNPKALLHHTERDSNNAFDLEDGTRPESPFLYFGNESKYLRALREFAWMTHLLGKDDLAKDAAERYRKGRKSFINLFWMKEHGYPAPLVFGNDLKRAEFISDEAMDGLYYRIFDHHQARLTAERFMQADIMTPLGPRSRSSESSQFYVNGGKAYWNGGVWPLRAAIAAEGMERYGFYQYAEQLDQALVAMIKRKGNVELGAVDRLGHLYDYKENGKVAACNPHLFTLGAVFARSAYPRITVKQYLKERKAKVFTAF